VRRTADTSAGIAHEADADALLTLRSADRLAEPPAPGHSGEELATNTLAAARACSVALRAANWIGRIIGTY
jgi:hypothetical protein